MGSKRMARPGAGRRWPSRLVGCALCLFLAYALMTLGMFQSFTARKGDADPLPAVLMKRQKGGALSLRRRGHRKAAASKGKGEAPRSLRPRRAAAAQGPATELLDDSFVQDRGHRGRNFGSEPTLRLLRGPAGEQQVALRFRGVFSNARAVLQLTALEAVEEARVLLCRTEAKWTEATLTWDSSGSLFDCTERTLPETARGDRACLAVPRDMIMDGDLAVVLRFAEGGAGGPRRATFASKEGGDGAQAPRVRYDTSDCSPGGQLHAFGPVAAGTQSDTLLVVTSCNELAVTLKALATLEDNDDAFDVLVVDDFSAADTVDRIRRRGFAVVGKERVTGLTHSWNLGYQAFERGGYANLILSNNDVLVPSGAVAGVQRALRDYPFVVPMSTLKGAGHNPTQAITSLCRTDVSFESYLSAPSNYRAVQAAVGTACRGERIAVPQKVRFNGFFFAFRAPEVRALEHRPGELFNPRNPLFGQEDNIVRAFTSAGIKTPITKDAFVHHYKSATVRKSGYDLGRENYEPKHSDLRNYHSSAEDPSAFLADPFVSGDAAHLGRAAAYVVGVAGAGAGAAAVAFAEAMVAERGWAVRLLRGRTDLTGVDLLLVASPDVAPGAFGARKPGLVTVALAQDRGAEWAALPHLGNFHAAIVGGGVDLAEAARDAPILCFQRCPAGTEQQSAPLAMIDARGSAAAATAALLERRLVAPHGAEASCSPRTEIEVGVLVRTYEGHAQTVKNTVNSLLRQSVEGVTVRVFLVDTSPAAPGAEAFARTLRQVRDDANAKYGACAVSVLEVPFDPLDDAYGYDATDWATGVMLSAAGLTHFMWTNGDNYYVSTLFETVVPLLRSGAELVAWDFFSHHPRRDGQRITVKIQRRFIDLGSFIASERAVAESGAAFMPLGPYTPDTFARDFFFVDELHRHVLATTGAAGVELVHEVLFHHI